MGKNTIKNDKKWNTPSLPGEPLSFSEFRAWINNAENVTHISLAEAKSMWAKKEKQIQDLIIEN